MQDREFVEMEVPYNGAPKRPGSPSPLTSPAHSTASRGGLLHACCGRCYPQRYQVRGRRILASTTSISEGPPSLSSHHSQPSGQPAQSHYQPVDPSTVPNVAFNVPGDSDRQCRQGTSSPSPYNETRVWAELGTAIPSNRSFLSAWTRRRDLLARTSREFPPCSYRTPASFFVLLSSIKSSNLSNSHFIRIPCGWKSRESKSYHGGGHEDIRDLCSWSRGDEKTFCLVSRRLSVPYLRGTRRQPVPMDWSIGLISIFWA